MQFCFPILTFTLVKLVPKLSPAIVTKDEAFTLFGETELIKGVICWENVNVHDAAKQIAWTFLEVTVIWLLSFKLAFVIKDILLYVIMVLNPSLL